MYMKPSESVERTTTRNLSAAWAQIAAVVNAVDATLGKWLVENYGIGLTEYRALLHLSRESNRELRISELAHRVRLNQSSVTRLVGRIESKQLVYRDTCPDDARGVFTVITDSGLDLVKEIQEPYEAKICELLQNAAREYPRLNLVGLDLSFNLINEVIS